MDADFLQYILIIISRLVIYSRMGEGIESGFLNVAVVREEGLVISMTYRRVTTNARCKMQHFTKKFV